MIILSTQDPIQFDWFKEATHSTRPLYCSYLSQSNTSAGSIARRNHRLYTPPNTGEYWFLLVSRWICRSKMEDWASEGVATADFWHIPGLEMTFFRAPCSLSTAFSPYGRLVHEWCHWRRVLKPSKGLGSVGVKMDNAYYSYSSLLGCYDNWHEL